MPTSSSGGFHHRSTTKVANKPFKSKHATKGQLKANNKGKVERVALASTAKSMVQQSKLNRRNTAKMIQKQKRLELMEASRLFQGQHGVSKVVAIVPLCADVDANQFIKQVCETIEQPFDVPMGMLDCSKIVPVERFKQKFQFVPTSRHLLDILDVCKVADVVVFLLSAQEEVDHFGDVCIEAIKAQHVPQCMSIVQHLNRLPLQQHAAIKKSLSSFMQHHFAGDQKIFSLDNQQHENWNVLRSLSVMRPKAVAWRDRYSYMLADHFDYTQTGEGSGTLAVQGYLRGTNLSANRLIHIPHHGDFKIEKIVSASHPLERKSMHVDERLLAVPDERQESLVSENEPDPMEGEQTWPTEEEVAEAEERVRNLKQKKKQVKVPKGTSSYQAAWIIQSDDEDEVQESGAEELMEDGSQEDDMLSEESVESESEQEYIDLHDETSDKKGDEYQDFDQDEEDRQYQDYINSKNKLIQDCQNDMEFPDEVDTPLEIPARIRFQKYRGLKSIRTSPWDPYENLPIDYSRIFQFKNFGQTRKRVLDTIEKENSGLSQDPCIVSSGQYVTLYLSNVPESSFRTMKKRSRPIVLFSLLPHEHKMSVLHFSVSRPSLSSMAERLAVAAAKHTDMSSLLEGTSTHVDSNSVSISLAQFTLPPSYIVKSKDPLLMCCGYRRYIVRPLYSHTRGGTNHVYKFERFLQPGHTNMGTVYAPIQYAPCPITLFRVSGLQDDMSVMKSTFTDFDSGTFLIPSIDMPVETPLLIGTGSVLSTDPTRIIAKRIILTGHPFKVHKRTATIRYMFHNPQDITWFKPVPLFTKYGRKGHISDSLGTHGYMKCMFDQQLKQQDTVCMYLYKRIYPKWNTVLLNDDLFYPLFTAFEQGNKCRRLVETSNEASDVMQE